MLLAASIALTIASRLLGGGLEDAEKLIANKQYKDAARVLRPLTRAREHDRRIRAVILLNAALRADGKSTKTALLAPYGALAKENLTWPRVTGFVAMATESAKDGKSADAVKRLDYGAGRTRGLPRVLVDEGLGDVVHLARQSAKAITYYKRALHHGNEHFRRAWVGVSADRKREPPKPLDGQWQRARKRIAAKIKRLEQLLADEELGRDFVLYRNARRHQVKDALPTAAKTYAQLIEQFPDSIYAEAARFYRLFCTPDRSPRKLAADLTAFHKRKPEGLYRGEALKRAGDAVLHGDWDLRAAARHYQQAIDWCRRMRAADRAIRLHTVPERSRRISAPPENHQTMKAGVVQPIPIPPEKLVNRATAKWYLNRLEREARYQLAFIEMAKGRWKDARKTLGPVLDLDPLLLAAERHHSPNLYHRLTDACRLEKLIADDREMAKVPDSYRLRILHADLLYLQRRWPEAERAYATIAAEAANRKRGAAVAVATTCRGIVLRALRRDAQATEAFRQVLANHSRHKIAARAAFELAGILQTRGAKENMTEALDHYRFAQKHYPGGAVAENALAFSIPSLVRLGRNDEARRAAAALARSYPQHDWSQFTKLWLGRVKADNERPEDG